MQDVIAALSGMNLPDLNEEQRKDLVDRACDFVGLPHSNGYFVFYTAENTCLRLAIKKAAIQALRQLYGINVTESYHELTEDIITFTVHGKLPGTVTVAGRSEVASGSVCLATLTGVEKANAFMAAETKALRRLTMALAGINLPDVEELPKPEPIFHPIVSVENVTVNGEPAQVFLQTHPFPELTPEQIEAGKALQRVLDAGKAIDDPGPAIGRIAEQINKQEMPQTEAPAPKPQPVQEEGGFGSMFDEQRPASIPSIAKIPDSPDTRHAVAEIQAKEVYEIPVAGEPSDPKPTNVEFKNFTARCTKLVRDVLPKAGKDVPNLLLPYLKKTFGVKEIKDATVKQWEATLSAIETAGGPQAMAEILRSK